MSDEELIHLKKLGGIEEVISKLKSSSEFGIDDSKEEVDLRTKAFGSNRKPRLEIPSWPKNVWKSSTEPLIIILFIAAFVQIGIGSSEFTPHPERDWVDGLAIFIAILAVVLISSFNLYAKELKLKELNEKFLDMIKVTVKRSGKLFEVNPDELVVGDLVKLKIGGILFADSLLLETYGIKIDESPLIPLNETVEKLSFNDCFRKRQKMFSQEENKKIPSCILLSGSYIKNGEGWMIVIAVGDNTFRGQLGLNVNNYLKDEKTPLEIKLQRLVKFISYYALAIGVATAIVSIIYLIRSVAVKNNLQQSNQSDQNSLDSSNSVTIDPQIIITRYVVSSILLGLTLIIMSLPEGIPLASSLAISYAIRKMIYDHNLVKKTSACEAVGDVNYICTDKTGTLTKNEMILHSIYDGDQVIELPESSETTLRAVLETNYYKLIIHLLCSNIDCEIDEFEVFRNESKTDKAFIQFMQNFGIKIYPIKSMYSSKKLISFNSERKVMTTFVKHHSFPNGARIIVKGASEVVLRYVNKCYETENKNMALSSDRLKEFSGMISILSSKSLRTISLAYKDISVSEFEAVDQDFIDNFTQSTFENGEFILVSIFGIKDSLKENVPESINACRNAGIRVVMITGDNPETAFSYARESNIINSVMDYSEYKQSECNDNTLLEADRFYEMIGGLLCERCLLKKEECTCSKDSDHKVEKYRIANLNKFIEIANSVCVIARSRPIDKYTFVLGLKELNKVVAVTGDGTNDAQALSLSDVGFAMGIQGTDIAKESADIIILDDNFSTISRSIIWSRCIYENIRKFIQFQLSINFGISISILVCVIIGRNSPITVIQMLWINLLLDTFGAIALGIEPSDKRVLIHRSSLRNHQLISFTMWFFIILQTACLVAVSVYLYVDGLRWIKEDSNVRIMAIEQVFSCYGQYPGTDPVNGQYYVASGNFQDWPVDAPLLDSATNDVCGDYMKYEELNSAIVHYEAINGRFSHLSIIFNAAVIHSIFNLLNSRLVDNKVNIFRYLLKNKKLLGIFFLEMILQFVIVQFGGTMFSSPESGLTLYQWGVSLAFGCITLFVSLIFKMIPFEWIYASLSKDSKVQLK